MFIVDTETLLLFFFLKANFKCTASNTFEKVGTVALKEKKRLVK